MRSLHPKAIISLSVVLLGCVSAQHRSPAADMPPSPFQRNYSEGETLHYRIQMTHAFDGTVTSTYDARVTGVVKKDTNGFYEEFQWTSVADLGKQTTFEPLDKSFRQILSLAPPFRLSIPQELTKLSSFLIGPITDLLTFYVDESLVIRQVSLRAPGDHVYLNTAVASSWGSGQDCLDFDVTVVNLDQAKNVGSIRVSHVPPSKFCIKPPVAWMETQVVDTPNNWYDVHHDSEKWTTSVGKETFVVNQQVDLSKGIILSATMDNPVDFQSRECNDQGLLDCSSPTNHKIVRTLVLSLEK